MAQQLKELGNCSLHSTDDKNQSHCPYGFDNVSVKTNGIEFNKVESIQNDRENDYGDAKTSHESIANFWNAYLERKMSCGVFDGLDATDVAVMLSLMKVSRLAYKRKEDSFVDFAAYADFAFKFESGN